MVCSFFVEIKSKLKYSFETSIHTYSDTHLSCSFGCQVVNFLEGIDHTAGLAIHI